MVNSPDVYCDIDDFIKGIEDRYKKLVDFWETDTCLSMIEAVVTSGKGFDSLEIMYRPDELIKRYGWKDVSSEVLMLFLQCLQNGSIGDEDYDFNWDDELNSYDPFSPDGTRDEDAIAQEDDEDYDSVHGVSMLKRGLRVDTINGQGSFTRVNVYALDDPDDAE